jgi:hypothetical protein
VSPALLRLGRGDELSEEELMAVDKAICDYKFIMINNNIQFVPMFEDVIYRLNRGTGRARAESDAS